MYKLLSKTTLADTIWCLQSLQNFGDRIQKIIYDLLITAIISRSDMLSFRNKKSTYSASFTQVKITLVNFFSCYALNYDIEHYFKK